MKKIIPIVAILVCSLLAGCRIATYEHEGTKVFVGSFLTDPKIGTFKFAAGPTTRSVELDGYESKSNAEQAVELLKAIK